ncbi:dihydropteroate synthase [Heyndrickxia sporothermodurans]|uniref:dihydropteroate synthase n=1 Tax=Heyndrickxia sporothermodurans TaxID=46224 RepID=UPI002DBE35B4|nr:dihydropteroate synthase [Heyndrickxia sporothermodurans]MEB6551179.1 dihydropteroate synthase [Heyndrickxia sporothermodurans]
MTQVLHCRSHQLDYKNKTLIMGILNITPDSFSDGGKYDDMGNAVKRAKQMIQDGADIIDIGGESTRPGHVKVSAEEEISRVVPIIKELSNTLDVPLSIDTYKAKTAEQAILAGAHIVNDIWGAKEDPEIANVAAEHEVPIILMHNRKNLNYTNFIRDVISDLYESITIAKKAGIKDENIVLDPGIGFAKDLYQQIELMKNLDKIVGLGYPVLLGTSRKSMIGQIMKLPVEERMEATGATVCFGIQKGCQIMRVHDVKEISRMSKMMDVLVGKGEING